MVVKQKYRDSPVMIQLGKKWVGIGGPVKVTAVPPKLDRVIKEATKAEYKRLVGKGVDFFVGEDLKGDEQE